MIRSRMTGLSMLALALITGPSAAQVQVPQLIKIQGFLTNAMGVPTNGVVNMTFGLYDAQSGGTLINQLGPQPVTVNAGVYDVGLSFQASDFMGPNRFLEITVDGEVMTPRTKVGSVPYTYKADLGDAGLSCWDLNGDGGCTLPAEDVDQSGNCNVHDCAGSQGPPGPTGPQGPPGPEGATGPTGPPGPAAANLKAGVISVAQVPPFSGPIVTSEVVHFSQSFSTPPFVALSVNSPAPAVSAIIGPVLGPVTTSEFTVQYTRPGYTVAVVDSLAAGRNSLAVVNGNPAISYFDPTNTNLKYVRATDAFGKSWGTPINIDTAGNVGDFSSLAVVNGNPAISYYDATNGDLKYVRANDVNGTNWGTPISLDTSFSAGQHTSLEVVAGNPAISYYSATFQVLKYVRANDANGTSWGGPIPIECCGRFTSLAVVDGNPAISHFGSGLRYVRANDAAGTSWGPGVTVDAVGAGATSLQVVAGSPAISYYGPNADLIYVRATDASGINWGTPVSIDTTGDVGDFSSLAVIAGNPAISYYDATSVAMKYVRANDASGTSWGPPISVIPGGQSTSLVEIAGNPAVSYGSRFIGSPPAGPAVINWIAIEP